MALVPMAELLARARAQSYAVPAFCVWNLETMAAVLRCSADLRAPVILMTGPIEFRLLSPAELAAAARAIVDDYPVAVALHLDHGDSLDQVRDCVAARYTSVMLDFSTRPFDENAAALREVAAIAHPHGITVEGEIGHVGRGDTMTMESEGDSLLTEPDEAAAYVDATGVDALAISIGNAHGHYARLPRLDFARLAEVRDRVPVPLVLHGGSGTPDDDLRQAISLGIAKVNIATELVTAVRQSLLDQWQAERNLWAPAAFAEAVGAVLPVVERWIRKTGAAGRA
jgi:tagatose 1,6-diphosphate aldolase GatY/KbaY